MQATWVRKPFPYNVAWYKLLSLSVLHSWGVRRLEQCRLLRALLQMGWAAGWGTPHRGYGAKSTGETQRGEVYGPTDFLMGFLPCRVLLL